MATQKFTIEVTCEDNLEPEDFVADMLTTYMEEVKELDVKIELIK